MKQRLTDATISEFGRALGGVGLGPEISTGAVTLRNDEQTPSRYHGMRPTQPDCLDRQTQ